MKKYISMSIIIIIFCFTLMMGCSKPSAKTIKIGHVVALTGDNSVWGISEKNALDMEIEKINAGGGVLGRQLQLISYDSKAEAEEGVKATKKLITDGVCAIIGPGQSGVALAIIPVTEAANIPFIATTATNPRVTVDDETGKAYKTAFRTCFIDSFQGTVAAQYVYMDLGLETAAYIYDTDSDYSKWLGNYFVEEFERLGGSILAAEPFLAGEQDFSEMLKRIKETNPEALFIPVMQKDASEIMRQAAEIGLDTILIGGDGLASPDLVNAAGPTAEGAYIVNIASLDDPQIQGFLNSYRAKFGEDPVMPNPIMAIDALQAIIEAIKRTDGIDSVKIIDELEKLQDFNVLSGNLTIDEHTHNPSKKTAVIERVENGKISFFKRYTIE